MIVYLTDIKIVSFDVSDIQFLHVKTKKVKKEQYGIYLTYIFSVYSQIGRTISKIPRDSHWSGAEQSRRRESTVTACRR